MASATASASTLASAPPTTYEARAPVSIRSNTTPRRIAIADLTPNNIGQLRRLNSVLFPVAYSQRFYTDVLAPGVQDICKLGLFNDIPVGNICCRFEADGDKSCKLYIMTLGILAPYRRLGVASALLKHLLTACPPGSSVRVPAAAAANASKTTAKNPKGAKESKKAEEPPMEDRTLTSIYLHVQTGNEEARQFYAKHGFELTGEVEGYYRRIEPNSAWILERKA